MTIVAIAVGAISPLGRGEAAYRVAESLGEGARVAITRDPALETFGLARPFSARVDDAWLAPAPDEIAADRAAHLLFTAFGDCLAEIARILPDHRARRRRVAMATSSGGMRSSERLFAAGHAGAPVDDALLRSATYFAPLEAIAAAFDLDDTAPLQFVTACAASTWAIGQAVMWLEDGAADLVFAGGYDAVGPFVASGFEALRATSASLPAPFRVGRDGMALGEGAGVLALVRAADAPSGARSHVVVAGFGASTDAVHITAPDRTGSGLALAGHRAIVASGHDASDVALVSAHATATPYNDAMEAKAIGALFPRGAPVVHPFKAQIGHALGAAGVLETLAAASALARDVLPAAAGSGEMDPEARVPLLDRSVARPSSTSRAALKLSAAFGGANAALFLTTTSTTTSTTISRPPVSLVATATVASADPARVAAVFGADPTTVARMDEISLLVAAAAAEAFATLADDARAPRDDTAVVIGHALATIDINERFYRRILARGPTLAEPRVFPPTSPNLCAGQLAILLGARGPSAALCGGVGGAGEALEVGYDLVRSGRAATAVVVAVDTFRGVARELRRRVFSDLDEAEGATVVVLGTGGPRPVVAPRALQILGHRGLAAWASRI